MNVEPGPWTTPPPAVLPARLRPFVASMAGYAADGLVPGVHRGVPGPMLTFILTLNAPLAIAATEAAWRAGHVARHPTVLGGLHTEPAFVDQPGRWSGVQLDVSPLGARRLFGWPAAALPRDAYDASALVGDGLGRLHDQLTRASGWPERYAVLVGWLLERLAATSAGGVRAEVVEAWSWMAGRHGRVGVAEVADRVGLGRRRLARVFDAELGVTPKVAARLMRFDAARRDVAATPWGSGSFDLSGVAVRHGYFDHAHLVREFTAFTGLSPTAWLRAEVSNVQAADPLEGPESSL